MALIDKETFAKHISQVLNPLVVLAIVIVFVAFKTSLSMRDIAFFVLISLFFSILIPVFVVVYMLRKGQIDALFIPKRADRKRPLLLSVISAWFGVGVLYLLGSPSEIHALMVCVATLGAVAFLVTLYWKVSLHSVGLWASCAVVVVLWGSSGWLAVLPAGMVSWARFELGVHSLAQIVVGGILGAGITFLVFGYVLSAGVSFDSFF